jgi:energy-coupling factor transport system ATP-binding protein
MDFCAENFERTVVMAQGEVLADGAPSEVFIQDAVLEKARVEAPQLARLADALGWASRPLTVDLFVDSLPAHRR